MWLICRLYLGWPLDFLNVEGMRKRPTILHIYNKQIKFNKFGMKLTRSDNSSGLLGWCLLYTETRSLFRRIISLILPEPLDKEWGEEILEDADAGSEGLEEEMLEDIATEKECVDCRY